MFLKRGETRRRALENVAFDESCGCACDAACAAEQRREDVRTWAITRGAWPRLG